MKHNSFHPGHLAIFAVGALLLAGCFGEKYAVQTEVHEDGSLDRTVSQNNNLDSVSEEVAAFGASQANGWSVEKVVDSSRAGNYAILLKKHFASAEEATALALAQPKGYRIRSTFEKQYYWFYTCTRYSDSYPPGIQYEGVSPTEYFDAKDLEYLKAVSIGDTTRKLDTAYEAASEKKIEAYLLRGFVETFVKGARDLMLNKGIESRWADTLTAHKADLLALGRPGLDINEELLVSYLVDSLQMPLAQLADTLTHVVPDDVFNSLFDEVEHSIVMPSDIVQSNSIRVVGRIATWKVSLGAIQDCEVYAESRSWNYVEIGVTLFVLLAGLVYFLRRRMI